MSIAHISLNFGLRYQRSYRVDNDNVERAAADQHVADLQRLLACIRLGNEQILHIYAQVLGVDGIERMLGVDEGRSAACLSAPPPRCAASA